MSDKIEHETIESEAMEFDIVIVGAGVAGLSAAIRLKQQQPNCSVIVLEKAAAIGAQVLSGAIMDPVGINLLLPNWSQDLENPFHTKVLEDQFFILTQKTAFKIPSWILPESMSNHGNFITSLGIVCRWLARKAEELGVEIYPGFSGFDLIYDKKGAVIGVVTGPQGLTKTGLKGKNYTPGISIFGKYILIAEGARGSLARTLIGHYGLDRGRSPQKYGIGFKEIWEIDPQYHSSGLVQHSLGWPLDSHTGGGSFLYHMSDNQILVGFVVHLDYQNPYLSPFDEFQRFKTHPAWKHMFKNARRLAYGARALTEGGWQSVPRLVFPGGALIGCAAGFVNVVRIKGSHNAILSAIMTADAIANALKAGRSHDEVTEIEENWREGLIGRDLWPVRNVKPLWEKYGTIRGLALGGLDMWCQQILGFSFLGTFLHQKTDAACLKPAALYQPILYPLPDNQITFDRASSIYLSQIYYQEGQPCNLLIGNMDLQRQSEWAVYGGPSERYCPAGVYEWIGSDADKQYVINAQNCIHCKTCDIKDPNQNIRWVPPEGGNGPFYSDM